MPKSVKNKKSKRRRLRIGGKFLGKGTFGVVVSDPILPCVDQPALSQSAKSYVSKMVKEKWERRETNTRNFLLSTFSNQKERLHRNFLLSEASCKIDKDAARALPQNYYAPINTNAWNEFLNEYDSAIILPKGKMDATHFINRFAFSFLEELWQHVFRRYVCVVDGMKMLLEKKNMMYLDLKLENMLLVNDDIFRIIDFSDITLINPDSPFFESQMSMVCSHLPYFTADAIVYLTDIEHLSVHSPFLIDDALAIMHPISPFPTNYLQTHWTKFAQFVDFVEKHLLDNWTDDQQAFFIQFIQDYIWEMTWGKMNSTIRLKDIVGDEITDELTNPNRQQWQEMVNDFYCNLPQSIRLTHLVKRIDLHSLGKVMMFTFSEVVKSNQTIRESSDPQTFLLYYRLIELIGHCCVLRRDMLSFTEYPNQHMRRVDVLDELIRLLNGLDYSRGGRTRRRKKKKIN